MFAQLEVLTDQTPTAVVAIPTQLWTNGKKLVYSKMAMLTKHFEVTLKPPGTELKLEWFI